MDSAFNQNQAELGIFILSVSLKMFANSNSFLDQVIKILWKVWGQSLGFKDSQNFVASNKSNLGNTMGIPQDHTNL